MIIDIDIDIDIIYFNTSKQELIEAYVIFGISCFIHNKKLIIQKFKSISKSQNFFFPLNIILLLFIHVEIERFYFFQVISFSIEN